jgi:hypothetical protein
LETLTQHDGRLQGFDSAGAQAEVAADLPTLAKRINDQHGLCLAAARNSLMAAFECGELLIKARALCGHGQWLPWLEANFQGSRSAAYGYIDLAENRATIEAKFPDVGNLTMAGAAKLLSGPCAESESNIGSDGDEAQEPPVVEIELDDQDEGPATIAMQPNLQVKRRKKPRSKKPTGRGQEIVPAKMGKEAEAALSRLVRALRAIGVGDEARDHTKAILELIKQAMKQPKKTSEK